MTFYLNSSSGVFIGSNTAKYTVGVFIAVLRTMNGTDEILIIEKRRGVSLGYQIPGGAKQYGIRLKEDACRELYEETGLQAYWRDLKVIDAFSVEEHWDLPIVFLLTGMDYVLGMNEELVPPDSREIKRCFWVPVQKMNDWLTGDHYYIALTAWEEYDARRKAGIHR